ncbi:MAG: nucleotidyl transferase AbiEii/AbiGii toxin family protein [Candidatus Omnitrophica bacterium]|nr:nucleotidyl transferase AbiEii/AbiGii toxin family protein [Candidatus Omnitrophota bacterium]
MPDYLHNHPEFGELLRAVDRQMKIERSLVEKDYWIMHVLYGLQQGGFVFELKGGTSLSKGYQITGRFSEDIDIRIEPPIGMDVKTGRNHTKPGSCEGRKKYYDWLAKGIKIAGIERIIRDEMFDNEKYFSGGIRAFYRTALTLPPGIKEGVLLEVGFDDVTPNNALNISSWALDFALQRGMSVIDNRAFGVLCYHPGYTFVEKLQTIVTKFRKQQETGEMPINFLRHYYDVFCLLKNETVQKFIGTPEYHQHKAKRFPAIDQKVPLAEQDAFLLRDPQVRDVFEDAYRKTSALYYRGQPLFDEIRSELADNLNKL